MEVYLFRNIRLLIILGLIAAFVIGLAIGRILSQSVRVVQNTVLRESGYRHINPVLICNDENTKPDKDISLQNDLRAYIDKAPEKDISVYYLHLNDGKWAGVNENETFSPASMLKVPTMLAVLKYAESHSDILSKEIYYDGSFNDNTFEYFKPQQSIQPGNYYTVDKLLNYMITNSDNNATRLLHTVIDPASFENIYINLGIQLPIPSTLTEFMSPNTYSYFFRLLFNSTYLSREMSEKALQLLIAKDFSEGLYAGVPSSVEVAQKFGEREIDNKDGTVQERELHDCGIIYAPNNPYILCVMTRGTNFNTLASEIKNISKLTYNKAE